MLKFLGSLLLAAWFCSQAYAAPFTAGNLLVYRVGEGVFSLVNTGNPVFLDEYTPTGTLVQSVPLPTVVNGAQHRLVASGTATGDGLLSRSADGRYVVLTGYDADPATSSQSLSSSLATAVRRVIGRVDGAGEVDTSTALVDANSGNNFRGVCSADGSAFWTTGGATGLHYSLLGESSSTQVNAVFTNLRQPLLYGTQLFVSAGTGALRMGQVPAADATAPAAVLAAVPGFPTAAGSPHAFVLLDVDAAVAGPDVMYTADDSGTGGLLKYSYDGSAWSPSGRAGSGADNYRGLTAKLVGADVKLYAVRQGGAAAAGGGELVTLTDATGRTGILSGTPVVLASSGLRKAMRGVTQTPVADVAVSAALPAAAYTQAPYALTLTVQNLSPVHVSGLTMSLTLPVSTHFSSSSGGGFTAVEEAGVVRFTGGSVLALSSVQVTVLLRSSAGGAVSLPAGAVVVDAAQLLEESDEANNGSAATGAMVVTAAAELQLNAEVPGLVRTGPEGFEYFLYAGNWGSAAASGVGVRFTLPAGVSYVSATGAGFTVSESAGVVTFSGGSLAPFQAEELRVRVTAAADAMLLLPAAAGVIDPDNTVLEGIEGNNTTPARVAQVGTVDLTAELQSEGDFQVDATDAAYVLVVKNVGTTSSMGEVQATVSLPAGITATGASGQGWTVIQGTGSTVTASYNGFISENIGQEELRIDCQVSTLVPAMVTTTATVSGGTDHSVGNNGAELQTQLLPASAGVLSFSTLRSEVNEEAGVATVSLQRRGGRTGPVSIRVTSSDGTATAPADYTAVLSQEVSFAHGEVAKTVSVSIQADAVAERVEQLLLSLSSPTGGATVGGNASHELLILEPDTTPPTLTLRTPASMARLPEGNVTLLGSDGDNTGLRSTEVWLNVGGYQPVMRVAAGVDNYTLQVTPRAGMNSLLVRSTDYRGNVSTVARQFISVVRRPLSLTTLPVATAGTVTVLPAEPLSGLEVGKVYQLKATAKPGYVWSHWRVVDQGAVRVELQPSLSFPMQQGLQITAQFMADSFAAAEAGEFYGLATADTGVTASVQTQGYLRGSVSRTGAASGTVKLGGLSFPWVGKVASQAMPEAGIQVGTILFTSVGAQLPLARVGGASLRLSLQLDMSSGTHKMTGRIEESSASGWRPLSVLVADRAAFDGLTPATSTVAATYTAAMLPSWSHAQLPMGDGVATVTVGKDGKITVVGTLADGVAVTATAGLSASRSAAVFASLYGSRGAVGASLQLDELQADSDLSSSSMWWYRPFISGAPLPHGWPEGISPQLVGAKYAAAVGQSVLKGLDTAPSPNATLTLSGGGLPAALVKSLYLSKTNTVTKLPAADSSYSLALTVGTGKLAGSFKHSDGSTRAFTGVILQKGIHRRGYGHFTSASTAGAARLSWQLIPQPALVITEVMPKNQSTVADEDGAYSDWLELYNPTDTAQNLEGWFITDDAAVLTKWRMPTVTLNARSFLLVWASAKNRRTPGQPLHTNFSLANEGEYLALVRPDGVTVEQEFSPALPLLAADESYGVNFNGALFATQGATVKYHVPTSAALGQTWLQKDFNDAAWRSGRTGIGFGLEVPGLRARIVAAADSFGTVNSVATATALLALPTGHANVRQDTTEIVPTLNYLGDGSDGHYDNNRALPGGITENYVVHATGTVMIPTTGTYVFGLNSDDGGRIRIDGVDVMVDDSNHGPTDNLSNGVLLQAGPHAIDVIMWEGGGGDEVELFAAPGTATEWSDSFALVGSAEGLVVTTPPLTAAASGGLLATNIQSQMQNKSAGCYIRASFTAEEPTALSTLTLSMRYADGFIAYLNGTEVGRRNAPALAAFDTVATASRTVQDMMVVEVLDLTAHKGLLQVGKNVLAVHGMNNSAADGAFLLLPELTGGDVLRSSTAQKFARVNGQLTATPGAANGIARAPTTVAETVFSVPHGFYSAAFSTAISCATAGAQIRYTVDGSAPTATTGRIYSGPVSITRTTILRAAAFKAGFTSAPSNTVSYFFLNDVIRQQPTGAPPAAGWPAAGEFNGQSIDYGMDPDVVNHTSTQVGGTERVKEALLALPSISLVTELKNLFSEEQGIYVNPYNRGFAWERPGSVEMLGDKGTVQGGFQANCGIRLRGGFSRSGDNPKHSFRVMFRSEYGDAKLRYPLFGNEGAQTFQVMDFRTAQNYSWSFGGDSNNTFMREEMSRELQGAMGQPHSRSTRYCHLYINGIYWGLYNLDERTEASFGESYLGGLATEYDVVKGEQDQGYTTGVTDGNLDAWRDLWEKGRAHAADPTNERYFALQGLAADGVTPTSDPVLLDDDNLIDYMLLTFWTGNLDGCTSAFLGDNNANNWFGMRNRTGSSRGFKFFAHDFEHSFLNVDEDRTGPFPTTNNTDFAYSNPMFLHHDLRPNAEYRMKWADRVQKHLFHGGALTAENVLPRMERRKQELDVAIIAEAARWGDAQRAANEAPLGRAEWLEAVGQISANYVPNRSSRVLAQLRADGLYPSLDAPELSQYGGKIALGTEVVITGHGGQLYYTLDGNDPRRVGGAIHPSAQLYTGSTSTENLIPLNQSWKYLADGSNQGSAWRQAGYDDSAWPAGAAELGYGDGDEATTVPFVDADAGTAGMQKNATTYFRRSFNVVNAAEISSLELRMKYDDAAIVYVNGVEAVRTANISSGAAHNVYASGATPDEAAYFDFTISPTLLVEGGNVVAVEIHQVDSGSSDISFSMSLTGTRTTVATPLLLTTTGKQRLKVRELNGSEWSALVNEEFDVKALPDLRLTAVANGSFTAGDVGRSFSLSVQNMGNAASNGRVTLEAELPAGLTATALAGSGWTMVQATGQRVVATRTDALAAAASFPVLTLTVTVANNAPDTVTLTGRVSGGGEANVGNSSVSTVVPVGSSGGAVVSFTSAVFETYEEDAGVRVFLQRTGDRSGAVSVRLGTAAGTAKAPADFAAVVDAQVDFPVGATAQSVFINVSADTLAEANETFSVLLSQPVGAALGGVSSAVVRIVEADAISPLISITSPLVNARVVAAGVTVVGTATDNKGVKRVQLSMNEAAFVDVPITLSANGLSAGYSAPVLAVTGANTVRVRSYDMRGNVSFTISRSFTYTPLRPLVVNVTPADSGTVSLSPAVDKAKLLVGGAYTLRPVAKPGFIFDRWLTPAGIQQTAVHSFVMAEGYAVTAVFVPSPFVPAVAGEYTGLLRNLPGVLRSNASCGHVSLRVAALGAVTGTLKMDGGSHAFTGQVRNDGQAVLNVLRQNKPTLQLQLTLDLDPAGSRSMVGTVVELGRDLPVPVAAAALERSHYDGLTVATSLVAGSARLSLPLPALLPAEPYPQQLGSGSLSWLRTGGVTAILTLPDGTRATLYGPASRLQQVALFVPLYSTRGQCSGTLRLGGVGGDTSLLSDDVLWLRPVAAGVDYPFGWPAGVVLRMTRL